MKKGERAHNALGERVKFTLRMPPGLAVRVRKSAEREGVTVTEYILTHLKEGVEVSDHVHKKGKTI